MTERWSYRVPGYGGVRIDVDTSDIARLVAELQASEKQVKLSINRALRRTAGTLRVRASKGLVSELGLRRAGEIRRRLRDIKLRAKGDASQIGIWFGLNDLPVRAFKGTPKEYAGGATFRSIEFPGAFVAKGKSGRRTIFKRSGRGQFPIVEQTVPIKEQGDVFVEDELFPDVVGIFMKNFAADLRARTLFGGDGWDQKGARG